MLNQHVVVNNGTPQAELDKYFNDPNVVVDVTNFETSLIPARFKSSLYTLAREFVAPHLEVQLPEQTINRRGIFMPRAIYANLSGLIHVEDIFGPKLMYLDASNLDSANEMRLHYIESLKAQWLRIAEIILPKNTDFDAIHPENVVIIDAESLDLQYVMQGPTYRKGFERPALPNRYPIPTRQELEKLLHS